MNNKDNLLSEWCPNCDNEVTLEWNIKDYGYYIYCPFCGERITICSMCPYDNDCSKCDIDDNEPFCFIERKYPKTYEYVMKRETKRRRCNSCGSPVLTSDNDKYDYQCMNCDYDLHAKETHNGDSFTTAEYNKLFRDTRDLLLLDCSE